MPAAAPRGRAASSGCPAARPAAPDPAARARRADRRVRSHEVEQRCERGRGRARAHQLLGGGVGGLGVALASAGRGARRTGTGTRTSAPVTRAGAAGDDRARRRRLPRPAASAAAMSCAARSAANRSESAPSPTPRSASSGRRDLPGPRARTLDRHGAARDRDARRPPERLDREQRADDGRDRAGRTHAQGLAAVSVVVDDQAPARELEVDAAARRRTRRSRPAPPA